MKRQFMNNHGLYKTKQLSKLIQESSHIPNKQHSHIYTEDIKQAIQTRNNLKRRHQRNPNL